MKPKKQKKPKEKFSFVFPNAMAKMMANVPMRAQLESSLISMSLIMISITLMAAYLLFFATGSVAYKIILTINLLCGFLFISSFLVTTYQQYISHMQMMGYDPQKEREDVLKRGHLFKRIKLALKERKKIKQKEKEHKNAKPLFPDFVEESLDRKDKIDEQQAKDFKELKKAAKKLEEEDKKEKLNNTQMKGGQE